MTTRPNQPEAQRAVVRHPDPTSEARVIPWRTRATGGFFVAMGGIHIGIVAADAETYHHFADGALFGFVRTGWADVFMATPVVWGLLLAAGEIMMGSMLLGGGRPARVGWVCVVLFQVLLMLFGWGFWAWSVPALLVLTRGTRTDWHSLGA